MALNRAAPAIRWGDNLENVLEFGLPLAGALTSRPELPGYEAVQSPIGSEDAWVPGRGEYALDAELGWVDLKPRTFPYTQAGWSGPTGVQSFLQWARDKRRFRFVPDKTVPDFWVDDCYLVNPIDDEPPRERDGTRRVPVSLRSTHMDFGWALRGVGIDFGPGTDLLDWPRAQFDRQANDARFHTFLGNVDESTGNALRDRHYEGTRRVALFEPFITNFCLRSEELDDAAWTKSNLTVSTNVTPAPDPATNADRLVETAVTTAHFVTQNIAVTADEWIAVSVYVKAGERFRGRFLFRDPTVTNQVTMTVRLDTGVITTSSASGTGAVLTAARIVPLANGWFRLELEGKLGGGFTTASFIWAVHDDSGNESYLGDVAKGMYAWGFQLERSQLTAVKIPCGAYIPTAAAANVKNADTLLWRVPWIVQPSWMYLKFVEKGAASRANFDNLVRWGELSGAVPMVRVLTGSGAGGVNPFWRFNWSHDGGTTQSAGIANVTPAIGDLVELYGRLKSDGSVELHQSVNGAAVGVFSGSGGQSLASKVITQRLQLGESAAVGLVRFKLGFAPKVTTLAQARVA